MPVADLAGTAMATAVMGNDTEAFLQEEQHLVIPVIGAERPAMVEMDGLRVPRPPILVENLRPVAGGDEWHGCSPSCGGPLVGLSVQRFQPVRHGGTERKIKPMLKVKRRLSRSGGQHSCGISNPFEVPSMKTRTLAAAFGVIFNLLASSSWAGDRTVVKQPETTTMIDIAGQQVPVVKGGLYDRYRSNPPLSVIAAEAPDVDLSWFRQLKTERLDIGFESYSLNFYYKNSRVTAIFT
eukprot:gene11405-14576_t